MQIPPPPAGRPRVGVPVRLSSSSDPDPRVGEANELFDYIVALLGDAGAEPVLLTDADGVGGLDGVLLPGGGDLDPALYGESDGGTCYDVNPGQDDLDAAVARTAMTAGIPLLGICRGHQLLNVLYGGTLIQDMDPGAVPHREPAPSLNAGDHNGPWAWHDVAITAGSKVAGLYAAWNPATVRIASGHHQAVARVGDGLVVTAVADDGTVEAIEDPDRWVASVQWHPEAAELPEAERLAPFQAFVEVCRDRLPVP